MNTQHLKYAIEVGKTGSITQAAENLYIGQPSLSKALKELEESLGIAIFKRTSKGAVPTAQGERFLVYAREVLRQVEKMESLARAEHLTAQLFHITVPRVSYINASVKRFLSGMKADSEMQIRVQQASALRAIQHVSEGISEIAVIRYPVRYERYFLDYLAEKKLKADTVWEGAPQLLMLKGHPLSTLSEIRREDLAQYPLIQFQDDGVPYLAPEEMDDIGSRQVVEVSGAATMLRALHAVDNAYGISSDINPEEAEEVGLTVCEFTCMGHVRDAIVYPQEYAFRAQDRHFIDVLYAERNKMLYGMREMLEMESES